MSIDSSQFRQQHSQQLPVASDHQAFLSTAQGKRPGGVAKQNQHTSTSTLGSKDTYSHSTTDTSNKTPSQQGVVTLEAPDNTTNAYEALVKDYVGTRNQRNNCVAKRADAVKMLLTNNNNKIANFGPFRFIAAFFSSTSQSVSNEIQQVLVPFLESQDVDKTITNKLSGNITNKDVRKVLRDLNTAQKNALFKVLEHLSPTTEKPSLDKSAKLLKKFTGNFTGTPRNEQMKAFVNKLTSSENQNNLRNFVTTVTNLGTEDLSNLKTLLESYKTSENDDDEVKKNLSDLISFCSFAQGEEIHLGNKQPRKNALGSQVHVKKEHLDDPDIKDLLEIFLQPETYVSLTGKIESVAPLCELKSTEEKKETENLLVKLVYDYTKSKLGDDLDKLKGKYYPS